jgi:hypothetical protein
MPMPALFLCAVAVLVLSSKSSATLGKTLTSGIPGRISCARIYGWAATDPF